MDAINSGCQGVPEHNVGLRQGVVQSGQAETGEVGPEVSVEAVQTAL